MADSTSPVIEPRVEDGVRIPRVLLPRLDASVAPQLRASVAREIEAGHQRLVLDLGGVDFMDSSALGALVSCLKALGGRGDMAVSGAHGAGAQLFKLTRPDPGVKLHDNGDAAGGGVRALRPR